MDNREKYRVVRDDSIPVKQVRVSATLWEEHLHPLRPNYPILLKNPETDEKTVASLYVDNELSDSDLHIDSVTAENLGISRRKDRTDVVAEAADYYEPARVRFVAYPSVDDHNIDRMLERIGDQVSQLFSKKYIKPGDSAIITAQSKNQDPIEVTVDEIEPNKEEVDVVQIQESSTTLEVEVDGEVATITANSVSENPSTNPSTMNESQSGSHDINSNNDLDNNYSISFSDIGGLDEEIKKIKEIVRRPLVDPDAFQGVEPPTGVLLHGPSGTGKTLLAKAVSNEIDANFISISGAEIYDKNYGESERQLRELFEKAKDNKPSIVFIDEFEAVAPSRETLDPSSQVERRVVTQLKTVIDNVGSEEQVVVIGATNHPDEIDESFLRPGRFDRFIEIPVPQEEDRREIFDIHTRNMDLKFGEDFISTIINQTTGYTGADIADLCMKANLYMQRRLVSDYPDYDGKKRVSNILEDEEEGYKKSDFRNAIEETKPTLLEQYDVDIPNIEWNDIGGHEEPKQKLREQIDGPLKAPELYDSQERSTGVLLYGPPGTGKTMIAKAMATTSNRVFVGVQATELKSKYVGETESNIRELFTIARQLQPSILYIDEIEAIARERGSNPSGTGVTDAATSQLLSELDGLSDRGDVLVVGSTNANYDPSAPLEKQNVEYGLDPAILRPGRLEVHLQIPLPDEPEREQIFEIHIENINSENVEISEEITPSTLAEQTAGTSGADIESICWEAKRIARREKVGDVSDINEDVDRTNVQIEINQSHFEEALDEFNSQANEQQPRMFS